MGHRATGETDGSHHAGRPARNLRLDMPSPGEPSPPGADSGPFGPVPMWLRSGLIWSNRIVVRRSPFPLVSDRSAAHPE